MQPYFLAFIVTLMCSASLVATKHWHGHFSMDNAFGVQNHHTEATPRIGGTAILVGQLTAWLVLASDVKAILGPMLLACLLAFVFGLAEDISKKIGVLTRLLATTFSGALAWHLTGVSMQNTGVPPLDWLLAFTPISVLFTAIAVGCVANEINIIDGFNGLATGAVTIMLGALGLIALSVDDTALVAVCGIVAASAIGFGAINWPNGKIFLGDGGTYLLGFLLAWIAVLLPMRNPQVNAWSTILVCAYPVVEVAFSVWRRRSRKDHHPGQPDKIHLHHLIHRRIVRKIFPNMRVSLQNGFTSPICWLFIGLPAALAVMFCRNTPVLIIAFIGYCISYSVVYARLA